MNGLRSHIVTPRSWHLSWELVIQRYKTKKGEIQRKKAAYPEIQGQSGAPWDLNSASPGSTRHLQLLCKIWPLTFSKYNRFPVATKKHLRWTSSQPMPLLKKNVCESHSLDTTTLYNEYLLNFPELLIGVVFMKPGVSSFATYPWLPSVCLPSVIFPPVPEGCKDNPLYYSLGLPSQALRWTATLFSQTVPLWDFRSHPDQKEPHLCYSMAPPI